MNAKRFYNSFDYHEEMVYMTKGEVNNEPSKTVPEMTMSLDEILRRYTRGGEIATLTPSYQDHDDFDDGPDISKMDAPEKLQYALDIKSAIKRKQREMSERDQKAEKPPVSDPEEPVKGDPPKEEKP